MSSEAAASSAHPLPLWAHAVGGSLGSAVALLLLYPLERVRIELQSQCAIATPALPIPSVPSSLPPPQPSDRSASSSPLLLASGEEGAAAGQEETPWVHIQQQEEQGSQQDKEEPSAAAARPEKLGLVRSLHSLWLRGQLYKGASPIVATLAISNFVFYFFNESMKRILLHNSSKSMRAPSVASTSSSSSSSSAHRSLIASSLAGIANVLLTNPLWVANLALITGLDGASDDESPPTTLFSELARIVQHEGWMALWNGTGTSILLVSNPVIQFFLYDSFKSQRIRQRQGRDASTTAASATASGPTQNLPPMDAFVLGALTKAIATIVTYPLQLAQTILRLQHEEKQEAGSDDKDQNQRDSLSSSSAPTTTTHHHPETTHYRNTLDCLIQLYRQEGVPGLFTGIRTKLLQTILTAAFTFLTYEQILRLVHQSLLVVAASSSSTGSGSNKHGKPSKIRS